MTCDQMCIYASILYRDSLGPAQTLQEWTVKGNKGPLKKTVMILFPHLPWFWLAPRPSILLALRSTNDSSQSKGDISDAT